MWQNICILLIVKEPVCQKILRWPLTFAQCKLTKFFSMIRHFMTAIYRLISHDDHSAYLRETFRNSSSSRGTMLSCLFTFFSCLNLEISSNSEYRKIYRPGQPNWEFTMWKFQDFSATQILCEINFGPKNCHFD